MRRLSPFLSSSTLARLRVGVLVLACVAASVATPAEARLGGGSSFGSRGTRTFSMPPSTATAPRPAFPLQRTETPSFGAPQPGFGGGFGQGRRFGFGSGLMAGLLGAGVLGMLTGHGFFGGIGGLMSLFGFLFQVALIGGLIWLVLGYFRSRNGAPAYAGRSGATLRSSLGGLGAAMGGSGPRGAAPITVSQGDFAAFERLLSDLQLAYSREDFNALSRLTTPEMLRHLGGEIEANQRQNVRNDLSDVRLLQGDLSEAWREGMTDYATVAMRFSARDVMLDRASRRVVGGDPTQAVEATEVWTFRREQGGSWVLSALQQTR